MYTEITSTRASTKHTINWKLLILSSMIRRACTKVVSGTKKYAYSVRAKRAPFDILLMHCIFRTDTDVGCVQVGSSAKILAACSLMPVQAVNTASDCHILSDVDIVPSLIDPVWS